MVGTPQEGLLRPRSRCVPAVTAAPLRDGLGCGGGLKVDAGERGGLALTASLEGFEFVHGLVELVICWGSRMPGASASVDKLRDG